MGRRPDVAVIIPWEAEVKARLARLSPVRRRIAIGVIWSATGIGIVKVVGLLASVAVGRALGTADFGRFGLVQSTVGLIAAYAGLGMATAGTKFIAELKDRERERAGVIATIVLQCTVVTSTLGAVSIIAGSHWLAKSVMAQEEMTLPLRLGAGLLLVTAVASAVAGILAGLERFREAALQSAASAMLAGVGAAVGAMTAGLSGALVGAVGGGSCGLALSYYVAVRAAAAKGITLRTGAGSSEWRSTLAFGLPAMMSTGVAIPAVWVSNVLLSRQEHGASEMGILTAATQWYFAALMLPSVIGQVLLPILSERLSVGARVRRLMWRASAWSAGGAVVVFVAVWGFRDQIMRAYGRGFEGRTDVLVYCCATAILTAAAVPFGQAIAAAGRMWVGTAANVAWAVCVVGLSYALRERGAGGIALARLLSYGAHVLWSAALAAWVIQGAERGRPICQP